MINLRLDENSIDDLLGLMQDKYPITQKIAAEICSSTAPESPCTHVYGCYHNGTELVSVMTATYSIVFPHRDGSRMVQISGAYTREDMRGKGYAATLLDAIENDARNYFHADYLCCDSTVDNLYQQSGFIKAPADETRLWKPLDKH